MINSSQIDVGYIGEQQCINSKTFCEIVPPGDVGLIAHNSLPTHTHTYILIQSEIFATFDILHSVGELPWSLLVKEEGEEKKGTHN